MVMTLFHSLICGVVALCTTQSLRFPCLMMAVRKHQNIVQWSYWRVPLNVVPPIPLLGYPDIDQRHIRQMDGRACTHRPGCFPGENVNRTALEMRASANGCAAQHGDRKPILVPVSYREKRGVGSSI